MRCWVCLSRRNTYTCTIFVMVVLECYAGKRDETSSCLSGPTTPIISPTDIKKELRASKEVRAFIESSRNQIQEILRGNSDRLLVIVGPCSVHDLAATMEYATRLRELSASLSEDLLIVMRVFLEKPRSTVGWKGLINDPFLDGSNNMGHGLRLARQILLDVNQLGLPCACEILNPINAYYYVDLLAYGTVGARTSESQVHRELVSSMRMPVGFKNAVSGDVQVAVDAVVAARARHSFLSLGDTGRVVLLQSEGNDDSHVILRGGKSGPNFDGESVQSVMKRLDKAGVGRYAVVDCSHGNSNKQFELQKVAADNIASQISNGSRSIRGLMLESFIEEGSQQINSKGMVFGQSITDPCIGWEETKEILMELAAAVRVRRSHTEYTPDS